MPHTEFIQDALNVCHATGGGEVILTPGRYKASALRIPSHVTLHLMQRAVLSVHTTILDQGMVHARHPRNSINAPLIFSECSEHIGLTGKGVLDGLSECSVPGKRQLRGTNKAGTRVPISNLIRPSRRNNLVLFSKCTHLRIEGVQLKDPASWTVQIAECSHLSLRNVCGGANRDVFRLSRCTDVEIISC